MTQSDTQSMHKAAKNCLQRGDRQGASERYRRILEQNPQDAIALANLGTCQLQSNQPEEAIRWLSRAIKLQPDPFNALNTRGIALKKIGRLRDALADFDNAISLKPDFATAHLNRGKVMAELQRHAEAMVSYNKAIALSPRLADAYTRRAALLKTVVSIEASLEDYSTAITLDPKFAGHWYNRGIAYFEAGRLADAIADYDKAIEINPGFAKAYNNRANTLKSMNRLDEALRDLEKAISLDPDYVEAHWNKALITLLKGNFRDGWALYDWRFKRLERKMASRYTLRPMWSGREDLAGKTLLIWPEQGLGDCIQFCRYIPELKRAGAQVVLETYPGLGELMRMIDPDLQVVRTGNALPDFDFHCPLMSLPDRLKTTLSNIPAASGYLRAPEARRNIWSRRLGKTQQLRIGLVWSGNPRHANDHNRSIPLQQLKPLLTRDVQFHCLQKDFSSRDVEQLVSINTLNCWSMRLTDFCETAALIECLDLVITVDTSVAHLAAALGKPTWILLPFAPDFRWMLAREDSPWYLTARLFRQDSPGDWTTVIERVAQELKRLTQSRHPHSGSAKDLL